MVRGAGDALAAVGTAATWAVLAALVATGRMELAIASTAALAVRTSGAALTTTVRAGARLFRTSPSLDDWARFLMVAQAWTTRRGTAAIAPDGPQVITAEGICFAYPRARPRSTASTWSSGAARPSPWSARTAPAKAPSPAS
ncbi:hypothetical protein [Streptomyces huiliensis]|uniref:hypothetical protein n=1 Tax=Streptomyces huiliensis TaxID=2876027 RepID=UPI001CBD0F27|nr:hypothetical protein [Streptomyces huiliensis]